MVFVERIEQSNDNPSDPRNREVVHPPIDPQIGNLATPINSSPLARSLINNLSAYRSGISAQRRGLEVGLAHGYWLVGPFAYLNPLRHTEFTDVIGLASAIGMIIISTLAILLYAASNPPRPVATITANPPEAFNSPKGWNEYAKGFLIGGVAGAAIAYVLITNLGSFKALFNL
ncbi:MAG: photosystem I reaction center subunit XI [Pegethrix bostrychoides GSE-TBD4-15B]|jgi:photosystem I subunit 11|uniref:Photosystem I reaction center subunit XI n=1 Tax=Pegethrix bostrychoides GSE-TBD4-15B TaxID=2839662 RepID=A0A951U3V4_9CYAN|nr:photosystem I reaction center subunit XI [Pegethrix bostrychoides GSE-TBD4-15B]